MNKAASIIGLGTGGTALSLGGAYMLGAFDSDQEHKNLEIPDSLAEFQDKSKGPKTVQNYFPNIDWGSGSEGKEWKDNDKPDAAFLGTGSANSQGRLVVNWEKFKCSSDDKWSGKIRWLWSFVNGDKGLILYASAKSSSSADSKLDIEGIIYAVEKETNKHWKIKHHKKSVTTNTTIDAWANKLPEVGEKFQSPLNVKEYWGFTSSSNQLTKLCKLETSQDNSQTPTDKFKGSWIWKHEEGDDKKGTLFGWGIENNQWLDSFYGATDPKVLDLVKDLSGAWQEEYFESKDQGVEVSDS